MVGRIEQEFGFLAQAFGLRAARQQVIASNVANADTPNYKARDLDFSLALRASGGGIGGPLALATTSGRHIGGAAGGGSGASTFLKYRSAVQPSIDNNTVDMDLERAAFAENALHYQFIADRIASKSRQIVDALKAGS